MGEPGEAERGVIAMATVRRASTYKTSSQTRTQGQMYVYGSAVRQAEVMPQRMPEEKPAFEKRTSSQVRQNRKRALRIDPAYAGFLAVAAIFAVMICVCYLRLQSDIVNRSENITALQEELAELSEQNDTAYQAAENSVNLEMVRNKAVNELGMVYAAQGRVVEYENPSNDYVNQYSDIPENGILAKSSNTSE